MKEVFFITELYDSMNRIIHQQSEYTEKALAEIIEKYDFIVGSKDIKHRLMGILPDGANIVYSPYIEDPTIVYAIKKNNIMDLFSESYKTKKVEREE